MRKWQATTLIAALAVAGAMVSGVASAGADPARLDGRTFDLQAHRGGLGLRPESTLASFANGLAVGVTTLEMDVQITKDGWAVVTHDRRVDGTKCLDTVPAFPGDPQFPYVGKFVNTLTLAEVKTLDCGTKTLPQFPEQVLAPRAGAAAARGVRPGQAFPRLRREAQR
jgi:glycerophosphoryl diester phosphodiesterase